MTPAPDRPQSSRVRCAIVAPSPAPYREPLFVALDELLELRVIYQSAGVANWDQAASWFPREHPYDAVHLRSWEAARPGRTPIMWPRGLETALTRFDPQVVVCAEFGPATLRTLVWCRRRHRPLVILTDVTPDVASALSPLQRLVHRWLAERAEGFVAFSSRARARLEQLGVSPHTIELSLQGADLGPMRAAAARHDLRPPDRPVRFISVGRLVPDKNYARLLDAFAAAEIGPERAELHVHGVGPLEAELRARAGRSNVAAVFHGHTPPATLPQAYAEADAFVLVSTFEPFGIAVREAVAAGLPLLVSRRVGAVDDLAIEDCNALLVDPDDGEEIAEALGRLCRDAGLRAALAAGSRELDARLGSDRDVAAFARAVLRATGEA